MGLVPWTETQIRAFLEDHCGLSVARPVKGRIVAHHDEVFRLWRDFIRSGDLSAPFDVVHADSHADLGMGDGSWCYVMGELLHLPAESRLNPREDDSRDGLGEGNYLTFAIACQWIRRLTYVHHQDNTPIKGDIGLRDIPPLIMKDHDVRSEFIQLKKLKPEDIRSFVISRLPAKALALEPEVRFETIAWPHYKAQQPFSWLFVAQSPHYTPMAMDRLIPVVKEYIAPE